MRVAPFGSVVSSFGAGRAGKFAGGWLSKPFWGPINRGPPILRNANWYEGKSVRAWHAARLCSCMATYDETLDFLYRLEVDGKPLVKKMLVSK